jgi:hypothetical protein
MYTRSSMALHETLEESHGKIMSSKALRDGRVELTIKDNIQLLESEIIYLGT